MAKPKAGATPALQLLQARGIAHRLHSYDFAPGEDGIGLQAAAALGVAPARLLKTLMVTLDDARLAQALVPADRTLGMKALAATLGAKRAAMAELRQAERASGYVKGGISPLGQRQGVPAVVDRSAFAHDSVLINGGRRGLQIELAPADLGALLDAVVADIAR
jgi:Cys-tRNA(Pro)/Cys-tRNA(Cys) deacylase